MTNPPVTKPTTLLSDDWKEYVDFLEYRIRNISAGMNHSMTERHKAEAELALWKERCTCQESSD